MEISLFLPDKGKAPSASWNQLPGKWKLLIGILSSLCIASILVTVLVSFHMRQQGKLTVDHSYRERSQPECKSRFPLDTRLPNPPRVFQELDEKEIRAVQNFLLAQEALQLKEYSNASLGDNFIFLVELSLPNKSDVLSYLDKEGPKPTRLARVVVFYGAKENPFIEEYVVYPTLKPTGYRPLRRAGTKYPIPYYARPFTELEGVLVMEFVARALAPADGIIEESFDGYRLPSPEGGCGEKCLVPIQIGFPASKGVGLRQGWVSLVRDLPGIDLNALPLAVLVEHVDKDVSKWTVNQVYYNDQFFPTINNFITEYKTGKVKKYNYTFSQEDLFRTSMQRRGKSYLKEPLRGPELVEPQGRRFSILGRKVKYMPWEFELALLSSKGLAIFDVQFDHRRILYELSVQEAVSFYSSGDPAMAVANYLDSFLGMGYETQELLSGVDCPFTAVYLDSIILTGTNEPRRIKNAICVFESNDLIAARRHRGRPLMLKKYGPNVRMEFFDGMVDYALVVRSIVVADNYDYIFDYILHLNGVIEVRASTSGYLASTPYYNNDKDFGFVNFHQTKGPLHDHMMLFKADIDLDGEKNIYETLDIMKRDEVVPWNKTWTITKKFMKPNLKKVEQEGHLHYNFDKPKYYVFRNPNVPNPYGYPVGYRIQIEDPVKQVYNDDNYVTKASQWSKYQMAVTRHKDSEPFGSSLYNLYGMENPVFSFDEFSKDNESIVNEDLVAWVTVGGLHIPNTEDIPTTFTTGNRFTFYIRPYGFFLEDPTMGSSDAVFVTTSKDRQTCCKCETYGTPPGSTCPIPDRIFHYRGD